MKFFNKILLFAALITFGTACENFDLDLQENPNAITPDKADVDALYNGIQLGFRDVYTSSEYTPGAAARMYHAGSFTYNALVAPATFNGLWNNAYARLFADINTLKQITDASGQTIHAGTARIMEAYTLMVLADLFDSVPYSQGLQGIDVISPAADSGAEIYAAAGKLLEDAIANLSSVDNVTPPPSDLFYGDLATGDRVAAWISLANTLKLRAALNTRLIDPAASAAVFNGVLADGNFIDGASEDFQFNYGNQRLNPNSRHWMYNNHYELDDGDYLNNYYMWLLRADKLDADGNAVIDPRIRYYFYRKVEDAAAQDPTTYSCHFSALPNKNDAGDFLSHWENVDSRLPYCIVLAGDGYSGRDHLNGEGIPPDGFVRTSYGLYPGGGQFDDSSYANTQAAGETGGRGEGILPIMLSSFVDFMRAEAALTIGTGEDAAALLESGIRASMAKTKSFESIVESTMSATRTDREGNSITIRELYSMTDEDVNDYVTYVLDAYNAAGSDAERLDIVIKEYYIAAWGNGKEAYNMYRRTGYPANMQPGLEPETGGFPYSMTLPTDYTTRNASAPQDRTIADRVFWDDGSADVY